MEFCRAFFGKNKKLSLFQRKYDQLLAIHQVVPRTASFSKILILKHNVTFKYKKIFVQMCKDDRTIIDNKNEETNGPDQMKSTFDPMKLKRYF